MLVFKENVKGFVYDSIDGSIVKIFDGELNEEEERKKFQEAVNSWRSGTDQKSNKNKEQIQNLPDILSTHLPRQGVISP